jgi:excisionase family DNA binding protein
MTTEEAARYLEMPLAKVRRLAGLGRLPAYRTDGRVLTRVHRGRRVKYVRSGTLLFRRADLDAWLEAQRIGRPGSQFDPEPTLEVPAERRFA